MPPKTPLDKAKISNVVITSGVLDERREKRNTYMSPPYGPASAQAALSVYARLILELSAAITKMNKATLVTKNPRTTNMVFHGITGNIETEGSWLVKGDYPGRCRTVVLDSCRYPVITDTG